MAIVNRVLTMLRSSARLTFGLVGALVLAATLFSFLAVDSGACSSHDDVAQRVAALSEDLQRRAASGEMTVDKLAISLRRMNEVTSATGSDYRSHCRALDDLRADLELRS